MRAARSVGCRGVAAAPVKVFKTAGRDWLERQMPGDEEPTPRDQVLFLARAESRVRIVEHLVESGAATQRELRAELDASRTTVSRALQSLAERGWVDSERRTYRLTRAGEIIASEFTGLLETVGTVGELSEFLRWFPADVDAPDFPGASDFEVTYSTDADPYAPARKQTEILHEAERLRVLLPAIDLESTETITEQVTRRGLEMETVVSPGLEPTLESDEFASLLREKVETGRSTVFVAGDDLPFYLGLAGDGLVQVGVADGDGIPRALFETTDGDIREWAESVYRDYRDGARCKSLEEF